MHRILSSFLVVLLVVASVGFGCAAPASSPKATAPCEVSLHAVNKVFCGKESTTLEVVFTIHNPNKGVVALNELTYNLSNGDNPLGTGGTNTTVYIPAGKEVRVSTVFPIAIMNVIGALMMQHGLPQDQAMQQGMGLWQRIGEDTGTWHVDGQAYMSDSSGAMDPVFFEGQYSVE